MTYRRTWRQNRRGIAEGFRSGLELDVAAFLTEGGYSFAYEPQDKKIRYRVPEQYKYYLPDFVAPNGVIIECKGLFTSADRKKQLLIREAGAEVRFLFNNPLQKIGKKSATTYGMWCDKHGFIYARFEPDQPIPQAWLDELWV